jgi:hypothetical protein
MSRYARGQNWSASSGTYRNGRSEQIQNPGGYFDSVGSNRHGYNSGYANGRGETIRNPEGYFKAVGTDRYGYNGSKKK